MSGKKLLLVLNISQQSNATNNSNNSNHNFYWYNNNEQLHVLRKPYGIATKTTVSESDLYTIYLFYKLRRIVVGACIMFTGWGFLQERKEVFSALTGETVI